jgi:hypothetical protein
MQKMNGKSGILAITLGLSGIIAGYLSCYLMQRPAGNVPLNALPDPPKLSTFEVSALLGSAKSSAKMNSKYEDCRPETAASMGITVHICHLKSLFWEQIDAENGGIYGASAVTNNLLASDRCSDGLRARFWGERLKVLGAGSVYVDTANDRIRQICGHSLPSS